MAGARSSPMRCVTPAWQRCGAVLLLMLLLFLLQCDTAVLVAHGRGIHATVEASWNETPLLQEGCEWAGRTFGDAALFRCLDALWPSSPADATGEPPSARRLTQQQQYAMLLDMVAALPEARGSSTAFFEVEMAARVYSPAVEAHYTLAEKALRETEEVESVLRSLAGRACGEPFAVVYTRAAAGSDVVARRVDSPDALKRVVGAAASAVAVEEVSLAAFDHRYTPASASSPLSAAHDVPAVVVLYGLPGCAASHSLHRAAVDLASAAGSTTAAAAPAYLWRHLPASVSRLCAAAGVTSSTAATDDLWDTALAVQGYGVTVDIKNMEYKVLDEKAAAQQRAKEQEDPAAAAPNADAAPAVDLDSVIGGFHMARLKQRHPGLAASLDEFATFLLEEAEEAGKSDMKVDFDVWELQTIGLAATHYVRSVENNSHRLHVLRDVVTRFPAHAAALSRIAARPGGLADVETSLAALHERIHPGHSALFLNGWRVMEPELSLFGVLNALKEEEHLSRQVYAAITTTRTAAEDDAAREVRTVPLSSAMREKVAGYVKRAARRGISAAARTADTETAYGIPAEYVTWLNNIETEPRLEGLPTQLSNFFATGYDSTPFPRRNVLNFVFLWNPVSKSSLQSLSLLMRLRRQGLIARYGVALVDPTWSPVFDAEVQAGVGGFHGGSTGSQAALQIAAITHHLAAAADEEVEESLLGFFVELLQSAMKANTETDVIADSVVLRVCERVAKAQLHTSVAKLTSGADFVSHYHEAQAALSRFRLSTYPATFLNGVPLSDDVTGVSAALQKELPLLHEWVKSGALTDAMVNMYDAILAQRGAVDHVQGALMGAPVAMSWSDTPDMVSFVESLPYMNSAAYAGEVPALTQIATLPRHLTAATLQQLHTTLEALEACAADAASSADEAPTASVLEVCGTLRLSVVSCPAAASTTHRHLDSLQRYLSSGRGVPETARHTVLRRYTSHLIDAVAASSTSDVQAVLDSDTVAAAALAATSLPADAQAQIAAAAAAAATAAAAPQSAKGKQQFCAAVVAAAASGSDDDNVVLTTNGRVITMDASFTAVDVLAAARLVAPITTAVLDTVMKVSFSEMRRAEEGGYDAAELDNNFYAGKVACLTSVFGGEFVRHAEETSWLSSVSLREERIAASAEEWKQLHAASFTVSSAGTEAAAAAAAVAAAGSEEAEATAAMPPLHYVTAIIDPSSREAQVLVSLAHYLVHSPLHIRLTVLLNPSLDVKFPIRDFYQFVASPRLVFDEVSGRVVAPAATFAQLPSTALLTLGVDEPPSWTVFSHDAEADLDNIMLSTLPRGALFVSAVYRMHSVLVTGDSTNAQTGMAPDGLPLSLLPPRHVAAAVARSTDTQVMANQGGYYQLQANPGLWHLSVKEGPVAAAYCIDRVNEQLVRNCAAATSTRPTNWTVGQRLPVVIDSFRGRYLSLQVRRTPTVAVADAGAGAGAAAAATATASLQSILQEMASDARPKWPPSWLSRGARPAPPATPTLNIFSVASGHLYERFLRMMMYSVHKTSSDKYGANTTRIKFWVIENFLSPQFKRYIPVLAQQLGFEVGFVTYRWPWWLPRQTEKQRKIWAYKILFLDVIFPLDVDRVVFVDADQTAQADLHELYNMDTGGKPVAMTPFCMAHRNEATVPFRFWEKGFWVNHLRGKPYHISAIFLVDLRRFRAMLAGDRYRSTYAKLATDPNSLANLDQDLPNYLQAAIPIFSLPEEWLWCETWCSGTSKSRAKTIDLCNNPLTKMPKLENAKTIIPGWEELDNKLQSMSEKVLAEL